MTSIPLAQCETWERETTDKVIRLDHALERVEATLDRGEIPLPARFCYHWRGLEIDGEVAKHDEAIVLRQTIKLCVLPYSAEDARRRTHMVGFLCRGPEEVDGLLVLRFATTEGQNLLDDLSCALGSDQHLFDQR